MSEILSSVDFFGKLGMGGLADYYGETYFYRKSVDHLVMQYAPRNAFHLDVGSAEGGRASQISYAIESNMTMCENCPSFSQMAWKLGPTITTSIESLDQEEELIGKFDLITCLGNALSHTEYIRTLLSIKKLLKPGGIFIIDVNNSYNVRQYGIRAIKNWLMFFPTKKMVCERNGLRTLVKFFAPDEIDAMMEMLGMRKITRQFLDYRTGELAGYFTGQIFGAYQRV